MTDETPENKTGAVDAGVFVAALVLLLVSVTRGWTVPAVLCGVVLIGVMVTNVARRQLQHGSRDPNERPWRRGK